MFPLRTPFFGYPFNNFYINNRKHSYSLYNTSNNRHDFFLPSSNFSGSLYSVKDNNIPDKSVSLEQTVSKTFSSTNGSEQVNKKDSSNEPFDNYFFDIFGLKLYFDDVMIICLLFFLYEEGVNDQELFISLILLLLS